MPLHILRHKKWHPWNKENQEQFDRDEKQHREEIEHQQDQSRRLAFSNKIEKMKNQLEANANTASSHQSVNRPQNEDNRVVLLNSNQNPNSLSSIMTLEREKEQKTSSLLQSSTSLVSSSSPPKPSITPEDESASHEQPQAINSSTLPIQVQARVQYGSNQDYLKEKEQQYKREMKEAGIANWRVNSFQKESQPWYLDTQQEKEAVKRSQNGRVLSNFQYQKQQKANSLRQQLEDPLFERTKPTTTEVHTLPLEKNPELLNQALTQSEDILAPTAANSLKGHEKHRHHHSHHHKHQSSSTRAISSLDSSEKEKLIEQLRRERLQREQKERKRATEYMIEQSGISLRDREKKR